MAEEYHVKFRPHGIHDFGRNEIHTVVDSGSRFKCVQVDVGGINPCAGMLLPVNMPPVDFLALFPDGSGGCILQYNTPGQQLLPEGVGTSPIPGFPGPVPFLDQGLDV